MFTVLRLIIAASCPRRLFSLIVGNPGGLLPSLARITLLVALLITSVTIPVSASVVSSGDGGGLILGVLDDSIWIKDTNLVSAFYNAGYDSYYNGGYAPLVYNSRWVLEYRQGVNWKQIGTPIGKVAYTGNSNMYVVMRNYTDYLGTTYSVEYILTPNAPIKINIIINSGAEREYRLVWANSGITGDLLAESVNRLEYAGVAIDWSDAYMYQSAYVASTDANGRKADITFTVGIIKAGERRIVDPSVVADGLYIGSVQTRNAVYVNGLHWVFYRDVADGDIDYKTSSDGVNWSDAIEAQDGGAPSPTYPFSVFHDGTYLHYSRVDPSSYDLFYRMGTLNANGTITWAAAEQTVLEGTLRIATIAVSSTGYPFISYYDTSAVKPYVVKSSTKDGTWTTQANFPYVLTNDQTTGTTIVPLEDGDMYAIYVRNNANDIFGKKWTASTTSWSAQETVTTRDPEKIGEAFCATAYGDSVYFVYLEESEDIRFVEYTDGAGWGADTLLYDGSSGYDYPTISYWGSGDLRVLWSDYTNDHIYMLRRISGSWDGAPIELVSGIDLDAYYHNSFYTKMGSKVGITYRTTIETVATVNYVFLEDLTAPTVITNAVSDITSTTATLNGEITATGGANATERGFEWDTDSGAPYANTWHSDGDYGAGTFSHGITGLPPDTTIYYRAWATNTIGTSYSAEATFDTLIPLPSIPTGIVITQTDIDELTITWDAGTYADTTMVRVSDGNYPNSVTDGYLVYDGALETATLNGLSLATNTYYFSFWSENVIGYSVDYAKETFGGTIMVFIGFFLMAGIISYLALRSNFPAIKMAAGFAWIAVMMYIKDNPPGTLVEGSAAHQALILVLILVGAGMLLTAVGGNINRQRNYEGGNASFGDWKWKFGGDKSAWTGGRASNGRETPEQYQLRVRSALRRDVKR